VQNRLERERGVRVGSFWSSAIRAAFVLVQPKLLRLVLVTRFRVSLARGSRLGPVGRGPELMRGSPNEAAEQLFGRQIFQGDRKRRSAA